MRDHLDFQQQTLPNGITLYTYRDAFPICCMELQLPIGFAHSNPTNGFLPGSAHFLEHTQLIRSRDFPEAYTSDRALGLKGGNSNAATQLTKTTHWIDTPLGEQYFGSHLLVDRVFHSLFNESDLATERSVVSNERNQNPFYPGKARTSQYYFTQFISDVYCPLEQVFGSDRDLNLLDASALKAMHTQVTTSEGIIALAVGDDDFAQLASELSELPIVPTSFTTHTKPTTWAHQGYQEAQFDTVSQPRLELAWIHDRPSYEEYLGICFLITMLINSTQGPLYREFREEKGWTYGLEGMCSLREHNLLMGLSFPVNERSQVAYIRTHIHDLITQAVHNQQLIEDELRRQLALQVYSYQTAGSIISAASNSLVSHGKIYTEQEYREGLEKLRDSTWREHLLTTFFKPEDMGELCLLPEEKS